jgi:mRNA interferase MazF
MCEQAKSLDISARKAAFIEKAPLTITQEVIDILMASVEPSD